MKKMYLINIIDDEDYTFSLHGYGIENGKYIDLVVKNIFEFDFSYAKFGKARIANLDESNKKKLYIEFINPSMQNVDLFYGGLKENLEFDEYKLKEMTLDSGEAVFINNHNVMIRTIKPSILNLIGIKFKINRALNQQEKISMLPRDVLLSEQKDIMNQFLSIFPDKEVYECTKVPDGMKKLAYIFKNNNYKTLKGNKTKEDK